MTAECGNPIFKQPFDAGAMEMTVPGRALSAGVDPEGCRAVWFIRGSYRAEPTLASPSGWFTDSRVVIRFTGQEAPAGLRYLNTFLQADLAFHAFAIEGQGP